MTRPRRQSFDHERVTVEGQRQDAGRGWSRRPGDRPPPAVPSPVTIVVATRNRRSMLAASLRRHLALPERPQVIVVDDASTDGTPAMLHQAFPGVQHIRLPSSLGAAARNAGARAAASPYVAFTDDDAWWRPGALGRAI